MLEAGGLAAHAVDGIRTADEDNPKGYFELERVKELDKPGADKSWVKEARGKGIKVISFLLRDLPEDNNYKIVFMHRKIEEVLASQAKMLERRGEDEPDPRTTAWSTSTRSIFARWSSSSRSSAHLWSGWSCTTPRSWRTAPSHARRIAELRRHRPRRRQDGRRRRQDALPQPPPEPLPLRAVPTQALPQCTSPSVSTAAIQNGAPNAVK